MFELYLAGTDEWQSLGIRHAIESCRALAKAYCLHHPGESGPFAIKDSTGDVIEEFLVAGDDIVKGMELLSI